MLLSIGSTRRALSALADAFDDPDGAQPEAPTDPLLLRIFAGRQRLLAERAALQAQAAERDAELQRLHVEREYSQAALLEHEQRWQLAGRVADALFWEIQPGAGARPPSDTAVYWTSSLPSLPQPPEYFGLWSERLHPDDRKANLDALARHLEDRGGHTPYEIEARIADNDGHYRWFRIHAATRRDEQGSALTTVGSLRDIHE
ncbi:Methyl-accepting chemotaxis protein [Pseudomonas amygdali pv. dendropanacis]|uniref:Methyl-accepting chemotaxis protein n=1 Tax=Pseudomonas amygdali pv. dendropanacis TaxID=235272 RepID=A0A0P9PZT5_PSEA0|nr:Methyl-accepting chemotaxis protein [Pseudomonas amygdali pv. dendropanacis]